MAHAISAATGVWTSSGTWGEVDATSLLNSETGTHTITTAYSGTRTTAFTPGAITVDAIAVKLSVRTGTTGTISLNLELDADDSQVAGTEVTIDVADLPAAVTAQLDGGWIVFKFSAPVALSGATAYQLAVKTSSASQVGLFRDGTGGNVSRLLRTTTAHTPVAGSDLVVAGTYESAGVSSTITVTYDETATTDYGTSNTSLVTPGLAVCSKGVLTWGTAAATNYYLKLSAHLIVYIGGTMSVGTTGTPIPRGSTAVVEFDAAADGDRGLLVRRGTLNMQALSRTVAKDIYYCLLNTDEAIASTSLGVDTDTGWLDNDAIVVATTTETASQNEAGALNGAAGASTLTVDGFAGAGGGLVAAHSGTSPTQAEVALLTRSIQVRSASSTNTSYVFFDKSATVDIDWAEFYYLGASGTSQKRGVEMWTESTGNVSIRYSSLHDTDAGGFELRSSALANVEISNNVVYNTGRVSPLYGITQLSTTLTGTVTINANIVLLSGIISSTQSGTTATMAVTNNRITINSGGLGLSYSSTVSFNTGSAPMGTISGNVLHGNAALIITYPGYTALRNQTITNTTVWKGGGVNGGLQIDSGLICLGLLFDGLTIFGCDVGITLSSGGSIHFKDLTLNGFAGVTGTDGIVITQLAAFPTDYYDVLITNGEIGTTVAFTTADIRVNGTTVPLHMLMRDTALGSTTKVSGQSSLMASTNGVPNADGWLRLQGTSGGGVHATYMTYGTISIDSTISHTASPSQRLTPNNASLKLESATFGQGIKVAVASGQTVTPAVYTYKSAVGDGAAYNGNQPRLIVRANPSLGITTDAVLDTHTAATGNWEQLTGTTASAAADGVLEFIVDCDGTAGFVNVDDWSAT